MSPTKFEFNKEELSLFGPIFHNQKYKKIKFTPSLIIIKSIK